MSKLRKATIELAHKNPELRPHLLPLLVGKNAGLQEDLLQKQYIVAIHAGIMPRIPKKEPTFFKNVRGSQWVTQEIKVTGQGLISNLRGFLPKALQFGENAARKNRAQLALVNISARPVTGPPAMGANFLFDTNRKMYGGSEGPGGSPMLASWSTWTGGNWWVAKPKS